jgi:hypothetical protein
MASSGTLRRVALVRIDVSEELSAYINKVARIGELETTLAVTSNRRLLHAGVETSNFNGLQFQKIKLFTTINITISNHTL